MERHAEQAEKLGLQRLLEAVARDVPALNEQKRAMQYESNES
jgi:hypothetical protein